jgi:hypothetical protein
MREAVLIAGLRFRPGRGSPLPTVIEWLGLAVAVVAAFIAWRANHRSHDANQLAADANTIAQRALAISEEEHAQRLAERTARARLVVSAEIVGYPHDSVPDADGVIWLSTTIGGLRLAITIRNEGDRDAGRGKIDVTFPESLLGFHVEELRLTDASGRDLSTAAQIGATYVLTSELDGVSRAVPETVVAAVPIVMPSYHGNVSDYSIRIVVLAEGADPAELTFPLRIGRDPNRP